MTGLEPARRKALAPKASVSTNSTTSAYDMRERLLYSIAKKCGMRYVTILVSCLNLITMPLALQQ